MTLHEMPEIVKSIFGLCLFLIFCGHVWNIIYAIKRKNGMLIAASGLCLLVNLGVLEVVLADKQRFMNLEYSEAAIRLTEYPGVLYVIAGVILAGLLAALEVNNYFYYKHVYSGEIVSSFADAMPVGMCYYRNGGRILLFNRCMERLCRSITGEALLNGETFAAIVEEHGGTISDGDRVWSFHRTDKVLDEREVHELLAFDVTELTEKNAELQMENERLQVHNKKLKEYYPKLDELIRDQEILQAKIDIHDGMNQLMLITRAVIETGDKEEMRSVLKVWRQNSVLLAKKRADAMHDYSEIKSFAELLGVVLKQEPDYSRIPEQYRELFCQAAREAIANAVKHANARNMEIQVANDAAGIVFTYANDGEIPSEPIVFSGGLANLERIVGEQGGTISVEQADTFIIKIHI